MKIHYTVYSSPKWYFHPGTQLLKMISLIATMMMINVVYIEYLPTFS